MNVGVLSSAAVLCCPFRYGRQIGISIITCKFALCGLFHKTVKWNQWCTLLFLLISIMYKNITLNAIYILDKCAEMVWANYQL